MQDFIKRISGPSSLYGLKGETLDSLVLSLLPPLIHRYEPLKNPSAMHESLEDSRVIDTSNNLKVLLMKELLQSLRLCAGFNIPPVSTTRLMAVEPLFFCG